MRAAAYIKTAHHMLQSQGGEAAAHSDRRAFVYRISMRFAEQERYAGTAIMRGTARTTGGRAAAATQA